MNKDIVKVIEDLCGSNEKTQELTDLIMTEGSVRCVFVAISYNGYHKN
jgi:hypothetical protein